MLSIPSFYAPGDGRGTADSSSPASIVNCALSCSIQPHGARRGNWPIGDGQIGANIGNSSQLNNNEKAGLAEGSWYSGCSLIASSAASRHTASCISKYKVTCSRCLQCAAGSLSAVTCVSRSVVGRGRDKS